MAVGGYGLAWLPRSVILTELDRRDLVPVGVLARRTIALDIRLFRPMAQLCGVAESFWAAATADSSRGRWTAPDGCKSIGPAPLQGEERDPES